MNGILAALALAALGAVVAAVDWHHTTGRWPAWRDWLRVSDDQTPYPLADADMADWWMP